MYLDLYNPDINFVIPVSLSPKKKEWVYFYLHSWILHYKDTLQYRVVTSGHQEELAIWTEGYVHGNKTDKVISKLIHVYGPTLHTGGGESNGS